MPITSVKPKRTLRLTSPPMRGADVTAFQRAIDARDRTSNVTVDGIYGPETSSAGKQTARELGVTEATIAKGATIGIQRVVRDPDSRTPVMLKRAAARKAAAEKAAKEHGTGRDAMLSFARSKIGVHEVPQGSNGGPQIDDWQKAAGMGRGPWCGAFAKRVALAGGVVVTEEARYVPWLKGHAHAGTGGYARFVSAEAAASGLAKPGDHVCFEFNGDNTDDHVGVLVRFYRDEHGNLRVVTIDGNTSGTNPADGGMVDEADRPATLVDGVALLRGV